MSRTKTVELKKNAFPLNPRHGILPHETFAVKSMDVNSNLLKLKLDMVYRDLSLEQAQQRFNDVASVPEGKPAEVKQPKRKVVKALVPKNK